MQIESNPDKSPSDESAKCCKVMKKLMLVLVQVARRVPLMLSTCLSLVRAVRRSTDSGHHGCRYSTADDSEKRGCTTGMTLAAQGSIQARERNNSSCCHKRIPALLHFHSSCRCLTTLHLSCVSSSDLSTCLHHLSVKLDW